MAKEMPRLGPKLMVSIAELLSLLDVDVTGLSTGPSKERITQLLEDEDVQRWLSEMRALGLGGGKDDERRASAV